MRIYDWGIVDFGEYHAMIIFEYLIAVNTLVI